MSVDPVRMSSDPHNDGRAGACTQSAQLRILLLLFFKQNCTFSVSLLFRSLLDVLITYIKKKKVNKSQTLV